MSEWFVWLIAVCATIYLLTESVVGRVWRFGLARVGGETGVVLAYCRACTGWWVGLATMRLFPHVVAPGGATGRFCLAAATALLIGYVWGTLVENHAFSGEKAVVLTILKERGDG